MRVKGEMRFNKSRGWGGDLFNLEKRKLNDDLIAFLTRIKDLQKESSLLHANTE